jgi:hypothetical protein
MADVVIFDEFAARAGGHMSCFPVSPLKRHGRVRAGQSRDQEKRRPELPQERRNWCSCLTRPSINKISLPCLAEPHRAKPHPAMPDPTIPSGSKVIASTKGAAQLNTAPATSGRGLQTIKEAVPPNPTKFSVTRGSIRGSICPRIYFRNNINDRWRT